MAGMKKPIKRHFLWITSVILCLSLPYWVWSEDREINLFVTDVLTFPSKAVQLKARLTERNPNGDVGMSEEPLEFFIQGRRIGQVTTDAKGWAYLEFTPKIRGNLRLDVKWATAAKADVVSGRGVVLSWERRRPLLLIDLAVLVDNELVTESPAPELFPDAGLTLGAPNVAAPEELHKLAKFYYNLVYLDRTGTGQLDGIQSWLRAQHFPPGMIRILPANATALSELLTHLQEEGWENVSGGIGRTADFAEVLVKNRLQTLILPFPNKDEQFPRRAIILHDWSRVRRHL